MAHRATAWRICIGRAAAGVGGFLPGARPSTIGGVPYLRDPRVYDDYWDYLLHEGLCAPAPEVVSTPPAPWEAWWERREDEEEKRR